MEWTQVLTSPLATNKDRITSAGEGGAGETGALVTAVGDSLATPQSVRWSDRGTNNSTPRGKPVRNENLHPHKTLFTTLFILIPKCYQE